MTFQRQGGLAARDVQRAGGGARSDQAPQDQPGLELSGRSRARRLRVSARLPLSFSALPCLQLSLGAMLSPLPSIPFFHRRASCPLLPPHPPAELPALGVGRFLASFHGPFNTSRGRGAVSPGSLCRGICKRHCPVSQEKFLPDPALPLDPPQLQRCPSHPPAPGIPCSRLSPFPGFPSLLPSPTDRLRAAAQGQRLCAPTKHQQRPKALQSTEPRSLLSPNLLFNISNPTWSREMDAPVKGNVPGSGEPVKPQHCGRVQSVPLAPRSDENSPLACPTGLPSMVPQRLPFS